MMMWASQKIHYFDKFGYIFQGLMEEKPLNRYSLYFRQHALPLTSLEW